MGGLGSALINFSLLPFVAAEDRSPLDAGLKTRRYKCTV